MLVEILLAAILFSMGVIVGVFLSAGAYILVHKHSPRIAHIINTGTPKGYLAGSQFEGERFPEDEAVKIQ